MRKNRKLIVEALDPRWLMASDLAVDSAPVWTRFTSEDEAITKLVDLAVKNWNDLFGQKQSLWLNTNLFANEVTVDAVAARLDPSLEFANHHVAGVSESDHFQMSAQGLAYVLREGKLRVIDVRDAANLVEVGSFQFTAPFTPTTMHLDGDRLVVIGNYDSTVHVLDIKDGSNPRQVSSIKLDGHIVDSRIVDGKLLIVQQASEFNPMPLWIHDDSASSTDDETFDNHETSDSLLVRFSQPFPWPSYSYETREAYISRLKPIALETLLPNYEIFDKDSNSVSRGVIGDWQDIALSEGTAGYSVFTVDFQSESPTFGDSSSVTTDFSNSRYITDKSVYFVQSQDWSASTIARVKVDSGEVDAASIGTVPGHIRDSRMLDEYNGDLRVAANGFSTIWETSETDTGNLYVLREQNETLEIIGELKNVAPGERVYSVEYDGERAVLTTALVDYGVIIQTRDPLHGIDLSDPTNPQERSELPIPGVSNYLHWVDDEHLVGVGFVAQATEWRLQVSLYNVADLSNPRLLDVWTGDAPVQQNLTGGLEAKAIHFDPATKTLIVPTDIPAGWMLQSSDRPSRSMVFHLDPSAADPLDLREAIPRFHGESRAYVVGNAILQLSGKTLETYDLDDPSKRLDMVLIANPLNHDYANAVQGEDHVVLDVLANDDFAEGAQVIQVSGGAPGSNIEILDNNRVKYVAAPQSDSTYIWTDWFTYKVRMADGSVHSTIASVWGNNGDAPLEEIIDPNRENPRTDVSQVRASLKVIATDDNGDVVSSIKNGDEVWIELQAEDLRDNPLGIFAVYADLEFDTKAFEVVGGLDALGVFTNVKRGEQTDRGLFGLGAVSESGTPSGAGVHSIVRFRLKALTDDDLVISVVPSKVAGQETLLYGLDVAVPHNRLFSGGLVLSGPASGQERTVSTRTAQEQLERMDIDKDGWVSPLDSLMVINRINAEANQETRVLSLSNLSAELDIDEDGLVTMYDALMLINRVNLAEGAIEVDAYFAEGEDFSESTAERRTNRNRRAR